MVASVKYLELILGAYSIVDDDEENLIVIFAI